MAVVSFFRNHGQLLYKIVIVIVLAATAAGCIYLGLNPKILKEGIGDIRTIVSFHCSKSKDLKK